MSIEMLEKLVKNGKIRIIITALAFGILTESLLFSDTDQWKIFLCTVLLAIVVIWQVREIDKIKEAIEKEEK